MSRQIQLAIALLLLVCMVCPFVEMAADSNDSIFTTGRDQETSIAMILLLVELAFALAGLMTVLFSVFFEKEHLAIWRRFLKFTPRPAIPLPETSPPLALRI
jgi:hypothetical protein